ncbi:hypothetical protein EB796_024312 [Bugula neritina]|uniref:Uncharacterized protein n=1 Tax=Bugula neritina TaxID=10212 RepID=A0A7J7IU93_BUGNE|nr:hypothetical protein EB796_024312 [Bugula neritina]
MRRSVVGGVAFLSTFALSLCFCLFFIAIPLLPVLFISPKWFRVIIDLLGTFILTFFSGLMELLYGIKFRGKWR